MTESTSNRTSDLIDQARAILSRDPDVCFAYLYGSFAKGTQRPASDVDLGVWLDPESVSSPVDRADRALDLEAAVEARVGRRVQVVVLNEASLDLTHNVLGHGILIVDSDPAARKHHWVEHARNWLDMAPARAIFDRAMARRIEEGSFGG